MSKINPTPEVSGKYGAPLGRANRNTHTDKRGNVHKLTVTEGARPMRLVRIHLNSGGYDAGGAYWGIGPGLYYFEDNTGSISGYVRGRTRDAAKAAVRQQHKHARFFR